MRIPSDLQIVEEIYKRYADDYHSWENGDSARTSKNYVPVDIAKVAKSLGVDVDIVWGRLYYDLDNRYSYQKHDDSWVHLFAPRVGVDKDCIHFPYLVSVISSMRSKRWQLWVPAIFSGLAIIVSVATLAWTIRSDLYKENEHAQELHAFESDKAKNISSITPSITQDKETEPMDAPRKSIPNQSIKPAPDAAVRSSSDSGGATYR